MNKYHNITSLTFTIKANNRRNTLVYLSLEQKKEIFKECNGTALFLFEFYLSKSGIVNYVYDDFSVANALEWSESTVKSNRLKLERAGYVHKFKATSTSGGQTYNWFFGKPCWLSSAQRERLEWLKSNGL